MLFLGVLGIWGRDYCAKEIKEILYYVINLLFSII